MYAKIKNNKDEFYLSQGKLLVVGVSMGSTVVTSGSMMGNYNAAN